MPTFFHKTIKGGEISNQSKVAIIRPNGVQKMHKGRVVTEFDVLNVEELPKNKVTRYNMHNYHRYFSQDFF